MPGTTEDSEWAFPNRATPPGSAAYYAVRLAAPLRRDTLAMLLAWHQLIRDIATDPVDPGVARLKLDWWRQELARMADCEARHPLAVALQDEAKVRKHAGNTLQMVIDAAESTIRSPVLSDKSAFVADCRASAGPLFQLIGLVDGNTAAANEALQHAGAYCEAVERIRHAMARPNRLPVAMQPPKLGALDPATRRQSFDEMLAELADPPSQVSSGFVRRMTALQRALHAKLRAQSYAIDRYFIDRAPIAHLWTAWRATRTPHAS